MKWIDDLVLWSKSQAYRLRAVVPGVVNSVATSNDREQMIDVQSATPDLVAGEAAPPDITPDTPMLNMTSGGYFVLMPVAAGDEVLGLCADRATGDWITTRTPGQVDEVNGARAHVLSDMLAVPFGISAPSGAPTTWSGLTLGGPAGAAIELDDVGEVTITKQGAPIATLTMLASGSVVIAVAGGQTIKLGGDSATLGVARLTDTTMSDTTMTVWMAGVQAVCAAAGAFLGVPAPVYPSDFGKINQASTKVLSE